jgi:threonine-phosphate decarboxylase
VREFEHGGDIYSFAQKLGISVDEVIDLSSNINFVKPKIDIDFNSLKIDSYPNYQKLYKEVAKYFGIKVENLELFNGATVAIDRVLSALRDCSRNCVIYSPAYLEYKRVAKKYNYEIFLFNRLEKIKRPPPKSVVIFINPSTPDGRFYDLKDLVKGWLNLDCKVIIDESFLEFYSMDESILQKIDDLDNLFIIKSMTKYFGSAGVRVGGLVSESSFIDRLKLQEPPWKISSFDSAYILSALEDSSFDKRSKEANQKSKESLKSAIKNHHLIKKIYPSSANFLLLELKIPAKEFQKRLLSSNIMVRECSNFDFLNQFFVRVAIKDWVLMERFIKAING